MLVGCGGWSKRKTLFGGDQFINRDSGLFDPRTDAAKIRAFFVHPNYARRGIARALLARCEVEAQRDGFKSLELMSILSCLRFQRVRFHYLRCRRRFAGLRSDEESFAQSGSAINVGQKAGLLLSGENLSRLAQQPLSCRGGAETSLTILGTIFVKLAQH